MPLPCFDRRRAVLARVLTPFCACAAIVLAASQAMAFDQTGFRNRLDSVMASVKAKSLGDGKAALAQLDEMVRLGTVGAQEYGASQPQFGKLMAAVVASSASLRELTDAEIEDLWGENGSAGDAVGVSLKSLGQFDATRAHLELIVGPSHAYIFLKKWQSTHKDALLTKTADELAELSEHLKDVK